MLRSCQFLLLPALLMTLLSITSYNCHMNLYLETFQDLLKYSEFRTLLYLFRSALLVAVGLLIVTMMLHILHYIGRSNVIYRRKPPVAGWNHRFFPVLFALIAILIVIAWGISWLLRQTV